MIEQSTGHVLLKKCSVQNMQRAVKKKMQCSEHAAHIKKKKIQAVSSLRLCAFAACYVVTVA